jgi:hypothetical protein
MSCLADTGWELFLEGLQTANPKKMQLGMRTMARQIKEQPRAVQEPQGV